MCSVVMYNHAVPSATHQHSVVMYSVVIYNQAAYSITQQQCGDVLYGDVQSCCTQHHSTTVWWCTLWWCTIMLYTASLNNSVVMYSMVIYNHAAHSITQQRRGDVLFGDVQLCCTQCHSPTQSPHPFPGQDWSAVGSSHSSTAPPHSPPCRTETHTHQHHQLLALHTHIELKPPNTSTSSTGGLTQTCRTDCSLGSVKNLTTSPC